MTQKTKPQRRQAAAFQKIDPLHSVFGARFALHCTEPTASSDAVPGDSPPDEAEAAAAPEIALPRVAVLGKRYQRWRMGLSLGEHVVMLLLLAALLYFGWSVALRQLAESFTGNPWLVVLIYLLPLGGLFVLASMVFSAARTFILDRRFAMTDQRPEAWLADEVKGAVVGGVLGLLLVEIFYALIRRFPTTWWLWTGVTFAILLLFFAHVAPVLIFPLFFRFRPVTNEEITSRLKRLAENAGTQVKGVYEFNLSRKTRAANAALVGLGRTRRIILADTLLDNFTLEEIEAVLAHEFGHHALWHLPKVAAIQTVSLFVFFGCLGWLMGAAGGIWSAWGFQGPADVANFPLVALVVTLLGLAMLPITNWLLRRFEKLADDFALNAVSQPQAFCSAFRRLAQLNLADESPNPLIEVVFHSHPSISRRIARAQAVLHERGAFCDNSGNEDGKVGGIDSL